MKLGSWGHNFKCLSGTVKHLWNNLGTEVLNNKKMHLKEFKSQTALDVKAHIQFYSIYLSSVII